MECVGPQRDVAVALTSASCVECKIRMTQFIILVAFLIQFDDAILNFQSLSQITDQHQLAAALGYSSPIPDSIMDLTPSKPLSFHLEPSCLFESSSGSTEGESNDAALNWGQSRGAMGRE